MTRVTRREEGTIKAFFSRIEQRFIQLHRFNWPELSLGFCIGWIL
jgi:hypothetical protein